jgi:type I restriction enzyme R subunit
VSKEKEWQTRKFRIDTRLTSLPDPWKSRKYNPSIDIKSLHGTAIEEYPTDNGPADYVFIVNGKIVGILEAKKVSVNPQNVLEQAKRYSRGLTETQTKWQNEFHVPFLHASNGEVIWHIDVRSGKSYSRTLSDFNTPEALEELFNRENDFDWFSRTPFTNDKLRPYQKKAVTHIEKALIQRKREMLLAMATGTGKTFTAVSLIYRLFEICLVRNSGNFIWCTYLEWE